MKRVYVAGLYSKNADGTSANVHQVLLNMRAGLKVSFDIFIAGFAPFCPWLDFQYQLLDDVEIPSKQYYEFSMAWLEVSDAVLVISGAGVGGGVDAEIKRANELGIPIFYNHDHVIYQLKRDLSRLAMGV